MTNRYSDEYTIGYQEAIDAGPRQSNPHPYHSIEWYAWDAGWATAERELHPHPGDTNLDLEAALAAWGR